MYTLFKVMTMETWADLARHTGTISPGEMVFSSGKQGRIISSQKDGTRKAHVTLEKPLNCQPLQEPRSSLCFTSFLLVTWKNIE